MPKTSVDRNFVPPDEWYLRTRDDFTILVVLFAGLIVVSLALAWLAGLWHF